MAKTNKEINIFSKKAALLHTEGKPLSPVKSKPNILTKELFVGITLYASAVLIILILFTSINLFTSLLIKNAVNAKNTPVALDDSDNEFAEKIIYEVDKAEYELNDRIKLSIINKSDKSIFLAPCQYFNEFEKKEGETWNTVILNDCVITEGSSSDTFEKIPMAEKKSILASTLGEGVWRGISGKYIDCQKAEADSCKEKKTIYSDEFKIKASKESALNKSKRAPSAL